MGQWAYEHLKGVGDKTGLLQIEWRENGRRLSKSLKHRDWARAKRQADEFAAGFAGPEIGGGAEAEPEPPTLETLFDIYGEEVTPTKGRQSRRHDRAAMRMFLWVLRTGPRPGWKTARTVLQCYQHADEDQLRNALDNRRRVRA